MKDKFDINKMKAILTGAALAIVVNLLVVLIVPKYFYRINAFMVVIVSIFLILKFFSEVNSERRYNGRKARKSK